MLDKIKNTIPTSEIIQFITSKYQILLLIALPLALGAILFRQNSLIANTETKSIGEATEEITGTLDSVAAPPIAVDGIPEYTPDEETLDRIEALNQREIQVGPEFQQDRVNPF